MLKDLYSGGISLEKSDSLGSKDSTEEDKR